MLQLGDTYQHQFSFTQAQVIQFAELSGDNNPLHLDADFAAQTPFKKPIIHGALSTSIFSKIMGTEFPGFGSVYLKQVSDFKRPMFVDTLYEARFEITVIDRLRNSAQITTRIVDVATGKITVDGYAEMINKEQFV
ncbi:MAG: MaoC family dehydratase [Pseudarcicella sp.]|nr:MaoC family dehydratase [Pseudarcicella sp.]MBP6410277.1 MaoC family dehydratase [Pseudarcicella sp.]